MQPRLKKRAEFLKVAKKGGYCPAATLIVQYLVHELICMPDDSAGVSRTQEGTGIRVGFTASRRVGGAVERNRAKRRLREAFELVLKDRELKISNCDIVIIAKQSTISAPFNLILRDLKYALKRCQRGDFKIKNKDNGSDRSNQT